MRKLKRCLIYPCMPLLDLAYQKLCELRKNLGHKIVTVLIDSGSTHNFVCERLAKKVGLQPISNGRLEVMVALGEKLSSPGKCAHTKLNLQGVSIFVDFYLLPLEG